MHTFVSTMCAEAGIGERKTNHSLRATGATAMFTAEVPEKMVKEVTGHKSSKALALYERPTLQQKQALSKVLAGGKKTGSFSSEVQKLQQEKAERQRIEQEKFAVRKTVEKREAATPNNGLLPSLFSGLTNCTINFCPQNFTIGFGGMTTSQSQSLTEECVVDEFDTIVSQLDVDNTY